MVGAGPDVPFALVVVILIVTALNRVLARVGGTIRLARGKCREAGHLSIGGRRYAPGEALLDLQGRRRGMVEGPDSIGRELCASSQRQRCDGCSKPPESATPHNVRYFTCVVIAHSVPLLSRQPQ